MNHGDVHSTTPHSDVIHDRTGDNFFTFGPAQDTMRVMFIHGGENPETPVPSYLRRRFKQFSMATVKPFHNTQQRVKAHARHLHEFKPDLVVGQGEGAMIILTMIEAEIWRGPSVLLAPDVVPGIDDAICSLPQEDSKEDSKVPVARVEGLWAWNHSRLRGGLRVVVVDDCHGLTKVLDDRNPATFENLGLPQVLHGDVKSTEAASKKRVTLFDLVLDCWAMRLDVDGPHPYRHDSRFPSLLSAPNGLSVPSEPSSSTSDAGEREAGQARRFTWRAVRNRDALGYEVEYDDAVEVGNFQAAKGGDGGVMALLLWLPRLLTAVMHGILAMCCASRWPLKKLGGNTGDLKTTKRFL
mmetsp:Transcript_68765/g.138252  ORF Transcript_68765/g.138252 Transcript_68765/m.138252 type:complete len:354 (-) Transcript_68765:100-1161(-)